MKMFVHGVVACVIVVFLQGYAEVIGEVGVHSPHEW